MTAIAIRSLTDEQIDLLKRTICKDGTTDDLRLFVGVCNATGLNPFLKQIYAVFRREKGRDGKTMVIQTGIDGLRLTADRSGKYAGQLPAQWCDDSGRWVDVWLDTKNPPAAARVGVLRSDFEQPCYATATWASYAVFEAVYDNGRPTGATKLGRFWEKMAPEQLAKCAEALALRKAFPAETAGLRTDDEMGQADNEVLTRATADAPTAAKPETPKAIAETASNAPVDLAAKREVAKAKGKAESEKKREAAAKNPQPTNGATVTHGDVKATGEVSPVATASPVAAPPERSPAVRAHEELTARLGGETWGDLAAVLLDVSPETVDRSIAESTRKAILKTGVTETDIAREAGKLGVPAGDIPTVGQCLALAMLLPLPAERAKWAAANATEAAK